MGRSGTILRLWLSRIRPEHASFLASFPAPLPFSRFHVEEIQVGGQAGFGVGFSVVLNQGMPHLYKEQKHILKLLSLPCGCGWISKAELLPDSTWLISTKT